MITIDHDLALKVCKQLNLSAHFAENTPQNADYILTRFNSHNEEKLIIVDDEGVFYATDGGTPYEHPLHRRYGNHHSFHDAVIASTAIRTNLIEPIGNKV
jgi:hypothetical protein